MTPKINFLSGVASYSVRVTDTNANKTFIVNIRPTTRKIAAMYITELFSNEIQEDLEGVVTIYDYHAEDYVDVQGDSGYVFLDLSHSYTITYRGEVLIIGFLLSNGHTSLLSSLFTFPPSEEEQKKVNMRYFTLLLKGSMNKGSNMIKVSSTDGLEEGRYLYETLDEDEDDYDEDNYEEKPERVITAIDYTNNMVTVDVEFVNTASNVTIYVR